MSNEPAGPSPSAGGPPKPGKLWSGRFSEATDAFVERFTASEHYDRRLAAHDIRGSIAHVNMLCATGIVAEDERARIVAGLEQIRDEIERGEFRFSPALEDVHMNIEARLTEVVGEVGKKLHTARSRNDQVATDLRLYLRDVIDGLLEATAELGEGIIDLAEREAETVMPGFTHLQTAQPITFGHHMLAWLAMLERDRERLIDCRRRVDRMPLGAAALAGTTFPIDRALTARELGFEAIIDNSLDAVSDRDFAIEFAFCAAMMMNHFSRWSEELVLWSSAQFEFVELPDRFCTGSSIMPQKKNPDVPELIRGKCARVTGHLTGLLVLMKAQPLAYNRDNQEDKEAIFDVVDTIQDVVTALTGLVPNIVTRPEAMRRAAGRGFATATDLADYLVRKGVPFRDAHAIVGRAVADAARRGCELAELSLEEMRAYSPQIDADVYEVLTLEGSVGARNHYGGTAPEQVRAAAARARLRLR